MSFRFKLVDEFGHQILIQGLRFVNVVLLVETPDELVASDGDSVRCGIGDRNVTNSVVIEFDHGRTSLQMAKYMGPQGWHRDRCVRCTWP